MGTADFLYDGDCAFCSASARFIMRHIPTSARVVAWQFADLDTLGVTEDQCDTAVQWVAVDDAGRRDAAEGPAAIAALMRTSTAGWRLLGGVLASRPALTLAWPVYRWVARNRDRMPGGTPTCALPAADRGLAQRAQPPQGDDADQGADPSDAAPSTPAGRKLRIADPSLITLRSIDHVE